MAEFLVELYVSLSERDGVRRRAEQARRAAVELTAAGTPVRLVRSIFVPEDETCLFLVEAPSLDAVRETARRASFGLAHVAETDSVTGEDETARHATPPRQRRHPK